MSSTVLRYGRVARRRLLRPPRLLPQELAWAALFALGATRLLAAPPAAPDWLAPAWGALALAAALPAFVLARPRTTGEWRARLLAPFLVMNAAYVLLGPVARAAGGAMRDAALQRADRVLFGAPLPLALDGVAARPAVADLLGACYLLFFPYLVVCCLRYAARARDELPVARRFFAGLFTLYAVGFAGYLLLPAQGPAAAMPGAFAHPIVGGLATRINDAVVRAGDNGVDAFPSLHVAVSAYLLFFDRRHAPRVYHLMLLPVAMLWLSTLALRFHYGIDVVAGFALAALALRVAKDGPRL